MLGSQLGNFLILILFKQLLSDKTFLEQEKNQLRIINKDDHNLLSVYFYMNRKKIEINP